MTPDPFDQITRFFELQHERADNIEDKVDKVVDNTEQHNGRLKKLEVKFEEVVDLVKKLSQEVGQVATRQKSWNISMEHLNNLVLRLDATRMNAHLCRGHEKIHYVPHSGQESLRKPSGFPNTVKDFWRLKDNGNLAPLFDLPSADIARQIIDQASPTLWLCRPP